MKKQFTLFLLLLAATFSLANTTKKESLDLEKAALFSVQDTIKPIKKRQKHGSMTIQIARKRNQYIIFVMQF